jgi:iron complex outermembrane recepter protein
MNIAHTRKFLLTTTVLAAGVGLAGTARAQSAPPAAATAEVPSGIADIVVTARKTSENLQSVPVAVTALNAGALQSRQVLEVTDLARTAPSLTISTGGTGPASIVYLAIRGQAQNSPNSLSDSSVGIYIDGVYVARPIVGNLGFLDAASAEVLRGPQGTLFGRNTTGGALNLTTNQPKDILEGYGKVGIGNYYQRVVEGVLNVPLADELAVRFAGRYSKHKGYFRNSVIGYPQGSVNGEFVGRGTLKWEPKDLPVKLTITGEYVNYKDNGNATAVAAINPAVLALPGYGAYINKEFAANVTAAQLPSFTAANSKWTDTFSQPRTGDPEIDRLHNTNKVKSTSATFEWDMGGVNLKSITAYRTSFTQDSLDLQGVPSTAVAASPPIAFFQACIAGVPSLLTACRGAFGPNPGPTILAAVSPYTAGLVDARSAFVSTYNQNQFSEELQLSGKTGNLDWQTGLYYFVEKGDEQSRSWVFGGLQRARTLSNFRSSSVGAFAQLNYHITDALRVTGGLRYTWDKRSINRHSTRDWSLPDDQEVCSVGVNTGKTAATAPCNDPFAASFKYPAWTAGVDYRVDDQLFLYAKTSGASMSGGFNSRFVPAPFTQQFSPETVRDVEVGLKGDLLDRRLRTNLSIFYARQSNVQRIVNALVGTTLTQFVTNTGKVNAKGGELEVTALPIENLELTASAAYLDAKYVRGSRTENQGTAAVPILVDRSLEPVTQAPKWTLNFGATQKVPTSAGDLSFHLDYAYTTSRALDAATPKTIAQGGTQAAIDATAIANRASIIKGYGLLNGRIAFTVDKSNIEIAVWGRNLANQPWFTNVFNSYTGLGATVQFQGAPRTFGTTATFKF